MTKNVIADRSLMDQLSRRLGAISREVDALRNLLLLDAEAPVRPTCRNMLGREAVERFLSQRCTSDSAAETASITLYQGYREWASQTGAAAMSHKRFALLLGALGLTKRRTQTGVRYLGIGLRHPDAAS